MLLKIALLAAALALLAKLSLKLRPKIQSAVAWGLLVIGIVIAALFGTTTQWVMPGFGGAAVGAGVGWLLGFGLFTLIGPQGIVPLGMAIAMRFIAGTFSSIGGLSGLAASFGPKTVLNPSAMLVWIPIVVTAFWMHGRANRLKSQS